MKDCCLWFKRSLLLLTANGFAERKRLLPFTARRPFAGRAGVELKVS